MSEVRIDELETEKEWRDAFPVIAQLWDDTPLELTRSSFVAFLHDLQEVEGYRLFGLFVDGSVVALAGVSIRMSAWYGRYVWVYDLVTDREHRSRGYGRQLLSYVKRWAEANGCDSIALASARDRADAHRFYENEGMNKSSIVFKQSLDGSTDQ